MAQKIKISNKNIVASEVIQKQKHGNEYFFDQPDLPMVGKKYLVLTRTRPGKSDVLLFSDDSVHLNEGMGGNMDPTVKRFNGWRGETDNCSLYAHGVRECKISEYKHYDKTVHIKMVFGENTTPQG